MKRLIFLSSICIWFFGCVGTNSKGTPKLEVNVTEINFCTQPSGETAVWNNLQLRNTGKGPLEISSLRMRGDAGCAFTCSYPDARQSDAVIACPNEAGKDGQSKITLEAGNTLLVRIEYAPSARDSKDAAALVIKSDAENQTDNSGKAVPLVIPMCGIGTDAGENDADGGLSDAGFNSESCAACESVSSDADYCKAR
jgi:hypothetical protein